MDESVVDLYLNNSAVKKQWEAFLTSLGITNFSAKEVDQIDFTIGIYNDDQLVATGSVAGNVLKYVGVCNKGITAGSRFNTIVSELINREFRRQIFHLMVFTKIKYSKSFQFIGFHELVHSKVAAFLEMGSPDVEDYLTQIPRIEEQSHQQIGGIVMNANPFTLGHRWLVEEAAKENDLVYVFVVHTEASLFTAKERFELVKAGTSDLQNVIVVDGGEYMVSYATFPAYFLPSANEEVRYQTTLDARIFREVIAPGLNIKTRYVGSEPLSRTTAIYNEVLRDELRPDVNLKVVQRKKDALGDWITATKVRELVAEDQVSKLADLVPQATYCFISEHQDELRNRIKRGVNIAGN